MTLCLLPSYNGGRTAEDIIGFINEKSGITLTFSMTVNIVSSLCAWCQVLVGVLRLLLLTLLLI